MADMITEILHITRAGKGLVKKHLLEMLAKHEFPKRDMSVDQVISLCNSNLYFILLTFNAR